MKWHVRLTLPALNQLAAIKDRRIKETIGKRIMKLEHEPENQGKTMAYELVSYRSIPAIGRRYRIIYRIAVEHVTVFVVALGIRKEGDKADIYALAKKLERLGLLDVGR